MIEMRRLQLSFGEGLIAEEVSDLREEWMTHVPMVRIRRDDLGGDNDMRHVVLRRIANDMNWRARPRPPRPPPGLG